MRVLHITRQFLPSYGGIEQVVHQLAKHGLKNGDEHCVLTLDKKFTDGEVLPSEDVIEGIKVFRISYLGTRRYAICWPPLKLLKNYDIIHLHSSDYLMDFLSITKFIHKTPIAWTTHGFVFHTKEHKFLKELYFKYVIKKNIKNVDKVICVSEHDLNKLNKLYNYQLSSKFDVIPNGIETNNEINLSYKDENLFVSVGRLVSNKNHDKTIKAFAEFVKSEQNSEQKLKIIGRDWGEKESLERLVCKLGLSRNIEICSNVSDEEKDKILRKAKYWIGLSDYESFGIAALEAMNYGCIIICNRIDAFEEFISDGSEGFFLDSLDPKIIQKEINNILEKDYLETIANNAFSKSRNYSWNNIIEKYNAIYQNIS